MKHWDPKLVDFQQKHQIVTQRTTIEAGGHGGQPLDALFVVCVPCFRVSCSAGQAGQHIKDPIGKR